MTSTSHVRAGMRPSRVLVLSLLAAALLVAIAPVARAADPFYEDLLRKGTDEYNRHDYAAAARSLRIATFGLLDEPKRLADALVRLGLAQAAAKDDEGFRETFRRVVEVEARFHAYNDGIVNSDLKSEYERYVLRDVPRQTLAASPGFAGLVGARGAGASGETGSAAMPPAAAPTRTAQSTPAPPEAGAPTPPPSAAPTQTDSSELAEIRALLSEGSVQEAFARARALADSQPGLADAQFVVAEAAYRLSDWKTAAEYFRRGGDPGNDKPLLLFYWAVSLYETGATEQAATVLRRSLPRIKRTDYVAAYEARILGSGNSGSRQLP